MQEPREGEVTENRIDLSLQSVSCSPEHQLYGLSITEVFTVGYVISVFPERECLASDPPPKKKQPLPTIILTFEHPQNKLSEGPYSVAEHMFCTQMVSGSVLASPVERSVSLHPLPVLLSMKAQGLQQCSKIRPSWS